MKKILAVMAKVPEPGKVKTRLCPPLTGEQARELYNCFLMDRIQLTTRLKEKSDEISLALAFDPPAEQDFFQKLCPAWFDLIPQTGIDLGERLANLFASFFDKDFDQAVVMDSDSPTLPLEYLEESFEFLETSDVVLGPSEDGGYYLIGLSQPQPDLFKNIAWSTPAVLEQTTMLAEKLRLKIHLLPTWYDVDTSQDLRKLRSEINNLSEEQRELAKNTAAFLKNLKNTLL